MTATTTWPTTADGKWLVLRTVDADWRSRDGFRWYKTVETVAPDWDPDPHRECGGGLHGLLWGCGDVGLLSSDPDVVWLVVAVDPADMANPDQAHKVRFRAGQVRFHGTRGEAIDYLMGHGAAGLPVVYGRHSSGYKGSSTSGYKGSSTSGDGGSSTSGYKGTSTSGYKGTSTSGDWGSSTSGYKGTSTSGDWGSSTSGYRGTSTSGDWGSSTAGYNGTLIITWHDGARYRRAVGYVGEGGLKPDTPYRVNERGEFVEVKS